MRFCKTLGGVFWAMLAAPVSAGNADAPPPVVTVVSDQAQRAQIIEDFQSDLGPGWRVQSCQLVIDYVQPAPTGRDTSWGAVCSIKSGARTRTVVACDDRMIGKFTMSENSVSSSAEVAHFIERNCPPGG
jgi:hypothetical protein